MLLIPWSTNYESPRITIRNGLCLLKISRQAQLSMIYYSMLDLKPILSYRSLCSQTTPKNFSLLLPPSNFLFWKIFPFLRCSDFSKSSCCSTEQDRHYGFLEPSPKNMAAKRRVRLAHCSDALGHSGSGLTLHLTMQFRCIMTNEALHHC